MKYFSTNIHSLFFQALSNPVRFSILQLLRQGPRPVSSICTELGLEQSHASHNLACLLNCGFVTVEPRGKQKIYSIDTQTIDPILAAMDRHLTSYTGRLQTCGLLSKKERKKILAVAASPGRSAR